MSRRLPHDVTARRASHAGSPEIIELLNDVLTAELTAINQYFGHAKIQSQLGLRAPRRAHQARVDRRDEARRRAHRADPLPRRHAQPAAAGLGAPGRDRGRAVRARPRDGDGPPSRGSTPASPRRVELGDNGTRELLERMLVSEEEHVDWLETQLSLIEQLGEHMYLASRSATERPRLAPGGYRPARVRSRSRHRQGPGARLPAGGGGRGSPPAARPRRTAAPPSPAPPRRRRAARTFIGLTMKKKIAMATSRKLMAASRRCPRRCCRSGEAQPLKSKSQDRR